MNSLSKIQPKLFFAKPWMVVCYVALCCLLLGLFIVPAFGKIAIIAAIGAFAFFILALSIHDVSFGFYTTIALGFLLAFIDRATGSRLPLYSVIFLVPFALFLFLIVRCVFYHERFKIDKHPLVYLYLCTVAYVLVQLFNPEMESLTGWVSYFRQTLSLLALFLVVLYLFNDLKSIRFFFKFLLGAILVTALYACIQQWIGLAPSDRQWVYGNPDVLGLYKLPDGSIRKFSFLTDPANLGTLMASGGVGAIILALESNRKRTKIVWGLSALIMFLSMSYSGTRTANIMVAAGLGIYIMMTLYQKRTRMLAIAATMVFLFIMNAPIYGNVTINRFRTAFRAPTHDASFDTRMMNRQKIRPFLYSHPFGGGVNTTGITGLKYNPHHPLAAIPPDSSLVATFMELGWVGLAMHLLLLFLILGYSVHYYYRCHDREIKTYYAIIVAMLFSLGLVGAYAQYTLINVPQIFVFIPFIAITIKLHKFDSR